MKISTKMGAVALSLTALAFVGQIARADSSKTTIKTTTYSSPSYVYEATAGSGPGLLVTTNVGDQEMIPSILNANPVLFVTTGARIVGFNTYLPNDLITRRDDLIARIYCEKANGKLSDAQAADLLAETRSACGMPYSTSNESVVDHARQVKFMYRRFDEVAQQIQHESRQGDRQLAGAYTFIVL
jgi:hypothetical protein